MSNDDMLEIKVPASSANLGPGFDSIGLAVNLYLTVEAEPSTEWEVIPLTVEMEQFSRDEKHFIVQMAKQTAKEFDKEMPPCRLTVSSEIPLARGLGSSAAAITAGIELASHFCGLNLSNQEKLEISAKIEGHPDNVGAAIYGGLVVGSQLGEEVDLTPIHAIDMDLVAVIPEEELLTKSARGVLPASLDYPTAVEASAIANQLLASLLTRNWQLAGKMMSYDRFHQPYRRELIPWWADVEKLAEEAGAFGTALSGAGPTILCFFEPGKGERAADVLGRSLSAMRTIQLDVDFNGSQTQLKVKEGKKSPI